MCSLVYPFIIYFKYFFPRKSIQAKKYMPLKFNDNDDQTNSKSNALVAFKATLIRFSIKQG